MEMSTAARDLIHMVAVHQEEEETAAHCCPQHGQKREQQACPFRTQQHPGVANDYEAC